MISGKKNNIMIKKYIELMLEYNLKVNIISRKTDKDQVTKLIEETLLLKEFISGEIVVDAGSGNGILGIPISITDPEKKIFLVESQKKKYDFLEYITESLSLENLNTEKITIVSFFNTFKKSNISLIARGFPDNIMLVKLLEKNLVNELLLITSVNKIKKMKKDIVKFEQKIYNIPSRDYLKIIRMRNVSRETLR